MTMCNHRYETGEKRDTWIIYDARGIALGQVCDNCVKAKKATYRPDVLSNPNYEADEPIEPEAEF